MRRFASCLVASSHEQIPRTIGKIA